MTATAAAHDDGPFVYRPRGEGVGRTARRGRADADRQGPWCARAAPSLCSYGTRLNDTLKAADKLAARGFNPTVIDARFAKPLDRDLIDRTVQSHDALLTIEEGALGGFGAAVLTHLADSGAHDRGNKIRTLTKPDSYIDHMTPADQLSEAGLDPDTIACRALQLLGMDEAEAVLTISALSA